MTSDARATQSQGVPVCDSQLLWRYFSETIRQGRCFSLLLPKSIRQYVDSLLFQRCFFSLNADEEEVIAFKSGSLIPFLAQTRR